MQAFPRRQFCLRPLCCCTGLCWTVPHASHAARPQVKLSECAHVKRVGQNHDTRRVNEYTLSKLLGTGMYGKVNFFKNHLIPAEALGDSGQHVSSLSLNQILVAARRFQPLRRSTGVRRAA